MDMVVKQYAAVCDGAGQRTRSGSLTLPQVNRLVAELQKKLATANIIIADKVRTRQPRNPRVPHR
jgi:hypothetical protein